MKIILSRKGCDSSAGGCASPIFHDDRIASLPIPDEYGPSTYRDIASSLPDFPTVGDLFDALGRPLATRHAHLDPDLNAMSRPRARGWRPTFGQDEAAEGHLRNNGITIGDLFLFFGWFQDVTSHAGRLHRAPNGRDIYLIFGWLQVGRIVRLGEGETAPGWTHEHPHHFGNRSTNNTLYIASDQLTLPGISTSSPGAGAFDRLHERRVLTASGARLKSSWSVPAWFMDGGPSLTFHRDPQRWERKGEHAQLRIVGRGQEFILDTSRHPEAVSWANEIVRAV